MHWKFSRARTVVVVLAGRVRHVGFMISTKASKTDGSGIEATGNVALERVASKHAEALGKCV